MSPMDTLTWVWLSVTVIALSLLSVTEKICAFKPYNSQHALMYTVKFKKPLNVITHFVEQIHGFTSLLMFQYPSHFTNPGCLTVMFMLTCIVFGNGYSSFIVSSITKPPPEETMGTFEELGKSHQLLVKKGQCGIETYSAFVYHPTLHGLCKNADNTTIYDLEKIPKASRQSVFKGIYSALKYKMKAHFTVTPRTITELDYLRFWVQEALNDCHESQGIVPYVFPKGWEFYNPKADTLMKVLDTLISSGIYKERASLLTFQIKMVAKRIKYIQPDDDMNTLYSLKDVFGLFLYLMLLCLLTFTLEISYKWISKYQE
ncbi:unnamed protein product [Allacma fusca]|uniref:Uncharacterized protein n=1 Tax=Allacma fusca TaxID=39272 RepID=A0A8J2KQ67_9HEXA|nr:unnamed protein product [Allacma fusca]